MKSNINLRGLALSKYKTIGAFANALGWKRNKVSRIFNGVQEPTTSEIVEIADKLDISDADFFISIFFASLSTMWLGRGA